MEWVESIELAAAAAAAEDRNRNGIPNVAEIAAAAGDGNMDCSKALDIAHRSNHPLARVTLRELELGDLELQEALKRAGAAVAERFAVTAQRVAAGLSAEIAEKTLGRSCRNGTAVPGEGRRGVRGGGSGLL